VQLSNQKSKLIARVATWHEDRRPLEGPVVETVVHRAFRSKYQDDLDLLWYLWTGPLSPMFGKDRMATFETHFIADKATHKEKKNPYFALIHTPAFCQKVLAEFGVDPAAGMIYRPGAVTAAMILGVTGTEVRVYQAVSKDAPESLPSPGVGMRHYAPRARLVLAADQEEMQERIVKLLGFGERVGVMLPEGWASPAGAVVFRWAGWKDGDGLARGVFAGLRELDAVGVGAIVCPVPTVGGVGAALRDRLEKAARRS